MRERLSLRVSQMSPVYYRNGQGGGRVSAAIRQTDNMTNLRLGQLGQVMKPLRIYKRYDSPHPKSKKLRLREVTWLARGHIAS